MSGIEFRRIHGRIVPIRRKEKGVSVEIGGKKVEIKRRSVTKTDITKAAVKVGFGSGIGYSSISSASNILKKSHKAFNEAARVRAASKLATVGSTTHRKLIKMAAKKTVSGRSFASKSRLILSLGVGAGSVLFGSAAADIVPLKGLGEEAGGVASASFIGASAFVFGRRFGIKGARDLPSVFSAFSSAGQKRTRDLIRRAHSAAMKKTPVKKGTQLRFKF